MAPQHDPNKSKKVTHITSVVVDPKMGEFQDMLKLLRDLQRSVWERMKISRKFKKEKTDIE